MQPSKRSQILALIFLVLVFAGAYFFIRRALIVNDAWQAVRTTRLVSSNAPKAIFVDTVPLQNVIDRLPDSQRKGFENLPVQERVQVVVFEGNFAIQPPHSTVPASTDQTQCVCVFTNIERGGRTIFNMECEPWK